MNNITKLISVIVPVYNVEAYVERCIQSVLKQDYENLEIILIDDGSTDNSGLICDKLAKQDSRIIVVHKRNEGLGPARNTGMEICRGEYIFFVDSDDYIFPNIISLLYQACIKYNAEIATCGYKSGKKYYYTMHKNLIMNGKEATIKMFVSNDIDANAVCKLYKRELFSGIYYPNCAYEVVPITYKVLLRAKQIVHIGECGYYIEKRAGSITAGKFGKNNLLYIEMAERVWKLMKKDKELEKAAYIFYLNAIISMAEKAQELNVVKTTREYSEVMNRFKSEFRNIIWNKYIVMRKKCIALMIQLKMYAIVKKIYGALVI